MKRSPLFLLALLLASSLALSPSSLQAELKTFEDVRLAIGHAKENNQLICFVMTRNFDDASTVVKGVMSEELLLHDKEFVVMVCQYADATHRSLFTDRFKQDISKGPVVVITDGTGIMINAASGSEREPYQKMIQVARVKAGFEKNPDVVAAIKDGKDPGMVSGGGLFGGGTGADGQRAVAMTKDRMWVFTNGATMEAALISTEGPIGTFEKKDGTKVQVKFEDLSVNDQVFIKNNVFGQQ